MSVTPPPRSPSHHEALARNGQATAPYTAAEAALVLAAGVAGVSGLINAGAAVDLAARLPAYARAYALLAAIEIVWAVLVAWHKSRELLVFGLGFSVVGLALGLTAQAGGLTGGHGLSGPGSTGSIHAIFWCTATLGGASGGWHATMEAIVQPVADAAIALTLSSVLLAHRFALGQRLVHRAPPLLLGVLLLSILYGVGAHSG